MGNEDSFIEIAPAGGETLIRGLSSPGLRIPVLQMMNYALKMMNSVLKNDEMMN